jgi:hypothetical protein
MRRVLILGKSASAIGTDIYGHLRATGSTYVTTEAGRGGCLREGAPDIFPERW